HPRKGSLLFLGPGTVRAAGRRATPTTAIETSGRVPRARKGKDLGCPPGSPLAPHDELPGRFKGGPDLWVLLQVHGHVQRRSFDGQVRSHAVKRVGMAPRRKE